MTTIYTQAKETNFDCQNNYKIQLKKIQIAQMSYEELIDYYFQIDEFNILFKFTCQQILNQFIILNHKSIDTFFAQQDRILKKQIEYQQLLNDRDKQYRMITGFIFTSVGDNKEFDKISINPITQSQYVSVNINHSLQQGIQEFIFIFNDLSKITLTKEQIIFNPYDGKDVLIINVNTQQLFKDLMQQILYSRISFINLQYTVKQEKCQQCHKQKDLMQEFKTSCIALNDECKQQECCQDCYNEYLYCNNKCLHCQQICQSQTQIQQYKQTALDKQESILNDNIFYNDIEDQNYIDSQIQDLQDTINDQFKYFPYTYQEL